jgi:UDP-hydrolysing UDP-N-acetyl-D-glucosamine 2-epimerase
VVTTGRADYGLLKPVVRALEDAPNVKTRWLVTGAHLQRRLGLTIREIERDGFRRIIDTVALGSGVDTPEGIAASIGRGVTGAARLFARQRPDILVVLGDRFETLAVAAAALPFNIVVAHIHGGERTEGLIDEAIRHAITKMSHLHFVSNRDHARRVRQMGEESWRVTVSGAPGLDAVRGFVPTPSSVLARRLGVDVGRRTLLVTYHPETLSPERAGANFRAVLAALDRVDCPIIFTIPNADTGRSGLYADLQKAVGARPQRVVVRSLGQQDYFSLLAHVGAMVGNSSSGLIEAPSFALPVVNVGDRQQGRVRARNVIDVAPAARAVEGAIRRALTPAFRRSLVRLRNPYGSGGAARRIVQRLTTVPLERLIVKTFVDR